MEQDTEHLWREVAQEMLGMRVQWICHSNEPIRVDPGTWP
jgi:hypothetical protein